VNYFYNSFQSYINDARFVRFYEICADKLYCSLKKELVYAYISNKEKSTSDNDEGYITYGDVVSNIESPCLETRRDPYNIKIKK